MSRLGDLENAIVNRLAAATLGGSPVFAVVRGASGPNRAALREALSRERPPAAFVAFVEELTAQETLPFRFGAQFSVFVAARMLRQQSNPRHGDATALGAFTLIDTVKTQLDNYAPATGIQLQNLDISFADADDRSAVYELRYRAWPTNSLAAPSAPLNLAETQSGQQGMMKLVWQAPAESPAAGRPDFYRLYKKGPSDSTFKLFETAAKEPTSRVFSAQALGQTVGYYVTAVNVAGEGAASNTLWIET
jgi:hypothetical protein